MKRITTLGISLIALIALGGAFASASAFAENPEILPVPTVAKPLTYTSTATETKLETTTGKIVKCKKAKNTGSFTTQDSGTVDITFEECKEPATNVACQSGTTSGLILTEAAVQFVDVEAALHLGVLITPHEDGNVANMLKFKCSLITVLILGAVIGLIDNKTGSPLVSLEKFKELLGLWHEGATLGEQAITTCTLLKATCEGKTFHLESDFGAGHELAAQTGEAKLTFAEEVEVHF